MLYYFIIKEFSFLLYNSGMKYTESIYHIISIDYQELHILKKPIAVILSAFIEQIKCGRNLLITKRYT